KMLLKFLDQTEDLLELLKSNSVNPDRVELISAPSGFRLAKGTKLYKDENADEIAFILGEKIITLKRLTKTDNPKVFRFEKITFEFAEKSLEYFEKHGLSLDGNILRDRENREVGFNQGQATVRFVVSGDGETVSVFEADYEDSAGRIGRESCWMTIKNGRIRR
ncbi:MAG: hypothetical protein NTV34_21915, partial [Proteobacteria bacterium]|nr:hypothetical protein [Pseudomonadota bacterium]